MEHQVVRLREGAIADLDGILERGSFRRLFFVVDDAAYGASGAAAALEGPLGTRSVTRFVDFDLNPKLDDVERGVEMFRGSDADVIIALGGGSAIDIAKLIGVLARQDASARETIVGQARITRKGPPVIAIPTTAGTGSEATHFAVVYVDGKKHSVADPCLVPAHAIIDPVLTHSLPPSITAATGLDAFCQAIESIWAVGATEASIAFASEAAQLAFRHLPTAVRKPDAEARDGMCRAAHLSGQAINISKTTAPHALSYVLTAEYGLPHGVAVALTLGPLLEYNAQVTAIDCADPRGPEDVLARIARIIEILDADDVAAACDTIRRLLHAVDCPASLGEAGIAGPTEIDGALQRLVSGVNTQRLSNNPRKTTPDTLHAVLKEAMRVAPDDGVASGRWTRRSFLGATAAAWPAAHLVAAWPATHSAAARADDAAHRQARPVGPILGHVDHERAMIWYRPTEPGTYVARLFDSQGTPSRPATATASPDTDLCVSWIFDGLSAGSTYRYEIRRGEQTLVTGPQFRILTAPPVDTPARTVLAFGSCASSTDFFDIWSRVGDEGAEGLVLLGDTPYINSSDLTVNRDHHRQFLSIPTLTKLCTDKPLWGTWDDHDFGGNDTDGTVRDKATIRKVFTEYRTQVTFGDGNEGIYTKFRRGPIEVFLIDARYFAQTGPSPVDPAKPTGLGPTQWAWLLSSLKASTAPFKVLATGMIWDDKENGEKDDWHTYAHEREALFDFIGREKITGIVLMGGDIHVSRHLKYPTRARIGYDLHQFITSPMHDSTIPSLNVPNPALVWGEPVPNAFLRLIGDSTGSFPTLTAEWIDISGRRLHRARVNA